MKHDLAMAKLNLAGIAFSKRRKQEANILLKEAQQLDKHNMLGEQIKMMKEQMKRASIPNQHFGGHKQPRSKISFLSHWPRNEMLTYIWLTHE